MAFRRVRLDGVYRLITRSDLDGVVSAMLLQERGYVDQVLFAHPKDVQDGTLSIGERDILVNLPYVPECALAFMRGVERNSGDAPMNQVYDKGKGSTARLVYSWLGGRLAFPRLDQALLLAVDKAADADYSIDEILDPQGWVLLAFLLDARTGLGRFKDFRLSNYQLMMSLIPFLRTHGLKEVLENPDVAERIKLYREHQSACREQILRCTRVEGRVGIMDLRAESTIWAGNRFLIYALFPQIDVSIHVLWGLRRQNTVLAVGRSVIHRGRCSVHLGELVAQYGGGGHEAAGTCQTSHEQSEQVLRELVNKINAYCPAIVDVGSI